MMLTHIVIYVEPRRSRDGPPVWFVSSITAGEEGRGRRSLKDERYFSRAIRSSFLGPRTVGISKRKHIFPLLPSPVTRHRIVRLHLVM